jgi:Flp pilus assembly protein TadB
MHRSTLSFEVSDLETKTYQVGNFRHSNWLIPLSVAILLLHFLLSVTVHFKYTIFFLLAPAFAVLIYYMTLGYKKYLSIKEF